MNPMLYCAAPTARIPSLGHLTLRLRTRGASTAEVDRLHSLDAQAVGEIHDRYYAVVYRYARFRLNDDQLAEDLTSDVFVRLIEALQLGKGPRTTIQGWLLGTTANLVADHYRRAYRHPQAELTEQVPANGPQPDDLAARSELGRHLQQALTALTPDQQDVVALRFGAGLSLEEAASSLGKEPNAIKALQFRAMAALRRQLAGSLR